MYDRPISYSLIIACEGSSKEEIVETRFGNIRSRSAAKLKYVRNDAKKVKELWENIQDGNTVGSRYLENPTKQEVMEALREINVFLSKYPQSQTGLDLYYAGHGKYGSGAFLLSDGRFLYAEDIFQELSYGLNFYEKFRGFSFMLDSCFSGGFLIDSILLEASKKYPVSIYDARISTLPDQKSWELDSLKHGLFTFCEVHELNGIYTDDDFFNVLRELDPSLRKQELPPIGSVSVSFLSKGKQYSIDCLKGFHISVDGAGFFDLTDYRNSDLTTELLYSLIYDAKVSA